MFQTITIPRLNAGAPEASEASGHNRGYAVGYGEGIRRAEVELSTRRAELEAEFATVTSHANARSQRSAAAVQIALNALDARLTPVLDSVQATLASASLALAEAILGAELSTGETGARAAAYRALHHADGAYVTTVRMNRDDLSVIGDLVAGNPRIAFVADQDLARGDAIAELGHGWLDARITAAVDRARAELSAAQDSTAAEAGPA